jgi:hypothetical protein
MEKSIDDEILALCNSCWKGDTCREPCAAYTALIRRDTDDQETRKAKFGNGLRKKELTRPKDGSPYGDIPYRWEDKFRPGG